MLSFHVNFVQTDRQMDRQTDGQTDNGKRICPRSLIRGHKNKFHGCTSLKLGGEVKGKTFTNQQIADSSESID